jgi:hypothetical protein
MLPEPPARDIFLSYAREDKSRAQALAEALEHWHYTVWWDRDLVPGENYRQKIEEELRRARVAVVLWSGRAAASHWVLEEASLANEEGKLIPVLLEQTEIPLSFRLIEAADLRNWSGKDDDAGFRQVLAGIDRVLGRNGKAPVPPPRGKRTWVPRQLTAARWLMLLTMAVLGSIVGAMKWPVPADLEVQAQVSRVDLRISGERSQVLLRPTTTRSLAVLGIERAQLSPDAVTVANPAKWNVKDDSFPEDAWTPLQAAPEFILLPADEKVRADITIRATEASRHGFLFGGVSAKSGEVSLEAPEPGVASIRLYGNEREGTIPLPKELRMDLSHCRKEGTPFPYSGGSTVIKLSLPEGNRLLHYHSLKSGLAVEVSFEDRDTVDLLEYEGLTVDRLQFEVLDGGVIKSTLDGEGEIKFKIPGLEPIKLQAGDRLVLDDLRKFRIAYIKLTKEGKLALRLEGTAGQLRSGPLVLDKGNRPMAIPDHRPTLFDKVWKNNRLVSLFTIAAWFVGFLVAGRKFLAELETSGASQ